MTFYLSFLIVFFSGFFLALIFTPIAIKLALKIGAVDIPKDNRRMHTKPMPRFGGMAIFIGTVTALLLMIYIAEPMLDKYMIEHGKNAWFVQPLDKTWGILSGGVLIYLLGIADDLKNLPAKVKLLGQIFCAAVVWFFGIRINFLHLGLMGTTHVFFGDVISFILTIIWIVGITNTVNLIDGLDGLAAGTSSIASLCLAYAAYIHGSYLAALAFLALAGSALGFLHFNFHPAKVFMGDGGSLFLGFMLSTISIVGIAKSATIIVLIAPVLVLGVPIFDTAYAILRRVANHRPIMEADKGHLHHRLMAAGLGQRRSVLTLYGVSAIMGVGSVLYSRQLYVESLGLLATACMYIYIFLTDATHEHLSLKTEQSEKAEETQVEAVTKVKEENK